MATYTGPSILYYKCDASDPYNPQCKECGEEEQAECSVDEEVVCGDC